MNQLENLLQKIDNKEFTIGIIGLGGNCIPNYDYYLTWKAREVERPHGNTHILKGVNRWSGARA